LKFKSLFLALALTLATTTACSKDDIDYRSREYQQSFFEAMVYLIYPDVYMNACEAGQKLLYCEGLPDDKIHSIRSRTGTTVH